jgi:hypothetical protein
MLLLEQVKHLHIRPLSPTAELLVGWDIAREAVKVARIPTLSEITSEEARSQPRESSDKPEVPADFRP